MAKSRVNLRRKHQAQEALMEGMMERIALVKQNCDDGIGAEEGDGDGHEFIGIMQDEAIKLAKRMGYDRYKGLFR